MEKESRHSLLLLLTITLAFSVSCARIYHDTFLESKIDRFKTKARLNKEEGWQNQKGTYVRILYKDKKILKRLNRKINVNWLRIKLNPAKDTSQADLFAWKMDTLWANVEHRLNMYPKGDLIEVYIFRDREGIEETFVKKSGTDGMPSAFYVMSRKRIVVAADSVNIGKLAHEFSHAVVDMYLGTHVPKVVHEILAIYVETHIFR
jgi:hypothetical protein